MNLQPDDMFKRFLTCLNITNTFMKSIYRIPITKEKEKEFLNSIGDYKESNAKINAKSQAETNMAELHNEIYKASIDNKYKNS